MRRVATFVLLALTACSAGDPIDSTFNAQAKAAEERAADAAVVRAGFAPDDPGPIENGVAVDPAVTPAPGAILPPATAQYRYLGKWAASPALCADGWWRFETRKLRTFGETSCELPEVAATRTGYELRGKCDSEGRKSAESITLRFDERSRRMRLEARTLGPADLLYCGP